MEIIHRLLDHADRPVEHARPHHLIRTEQDAIPESRVDDTLQESIEHLPGLRIHDDADIDIDLGVRVQEGEKVIDELWDVIAARGFEAEPFFEIAAVEIRSLPKLEGTAHVNMALIVKFMENYFFRPVDYREPPPRTPDRPPGLPPIRLSLTRSPHCSRTSAAEAVPFRTRWTVEAAESLPAPFGGRVFHGCRCHQPVATVPPNRGAT